jgi:Domain of unknown function (DUF1904)
MLPEGIQMPQLWIRGISVDTLQRIAKPLIRELATICSCGTDNFSIERIAGSTIFYEDDAPNFPFIEVKWFDRGVKVQDQFAAAVTRHLEFAGIKEPEIAFVVYHEEQYYINGVRVR